MQSYSTSFFGADDNTVLCCLPSCALVKVKTGKAAVQSSNNERIIIVSIMFICLCLCILALHCILHSERRVGINTFCVHQ